MRVLVVARNTVAHGSPGGMETAMAAFAKSLASTGLELALVTTRGLDRAHPDLSSFREIWEVQSTTPGRYSRAWWRETGLRGPWDDWQPHLVLGIGDAAGSFTRRRQRTAPVLIQSHGTPLTEMRSALSSASPASIARALLNIARIPSRRSFYRNARASIAISPAIRASIERLSGGAAAVVELSNIIEPEKFDFSLLSRSQWRASHGWSEDDRVGLYLGRLDRQKGVDILISAVSHARGAIDRFLIVGDGPDRARLEKLTRRLRLNDRVHFAGRLASAAVPEALAASDVLLFATRRAEGLPMILLEAAAAGLPLIVTRNAAVPDDVEKSPKVKIVPGEPRAFALALRGHSWDLDRTSYLPQRFFGPEYAERAKRIIDLAIAE